ncbi:MAG: glycosyltransferase family 2 protein, partial [Candidatus Bathyarchaeota archaeon]|nr:glycosyltransferase family 2 protein [Candidatus Bathyarchaeota archaeon]
MSAKLQRVSVLIRTKDIENYFRELLESLSRQTLQPSEIVVVDNFSSKSKLNEMADILKNAKRRLFDSRVKIKLVPITDEEFSYPYSANVGISIAEYDLVCMTNGHCLPLSDKWLESGAVHFEGQDVAGVGGYTLPHKNGTRWERLAFDWGWRRLHELSKAYLRDNYFSTVNCILR